MNTAQMRMMWDIDEFKVTGAMLQRGKRVWGERGQTISFIQTKAH